MKKIIGIALTTWALSVSANVIQFLSGLSFNNPALLTQVKQNEFVLGTTIVGVNGKFKGSQLNLMTFTPAFGESRTHATSFVPYGRAAQRINDKWVFSFDVTEPFNSNLQWDRYAVTRYAAVDTILHDFDFSPKLAVQFNDKLQLGAGINFSVLYNHLASWVMPTPGGDALLANSSSSVGYGFNAGLNYLITPMNQLGFTYYSRIRQRTEGYSQLGMVYSAPMQFHFNFPETMLLSYLHIFNQKWLMNLQLIRTSWSANQVLTFSNTASVINTFNFQMQFKDAYAGMIVIRHQFNDKWAMSLFGMVDDGPERDHLRPLNFPSDVQYVGAVGAEYFFSKNTMVQVLAGGLYSNTMLGNTITIPGVGTRPFTQGRVKFGAPFVDLRVKITA
ncbi:OmpP1/FadL family transporter [Legionella sp. W05-934-2]|uniref:OmpP1/FadL family transporter n=1 Tax=Legionella sp. W05-934-2 TaxID=1198649 RepID=UPI00346304AC